ncbi:hypothetical protein PR202_gb11737 [Eleusine coracana subsp. coracana]|uniref:Uncharacterized protein n=1 Tax=Eleusine coracana subsp. coracana TaxID=191504 RepID=A0AAV5EP46_ELECO|nr:hypothetical protein PR202_gb11737 [Eleusine coracana subsp. coracana]
MSSVGAPYHSISSAADGSCGVRDAAGVDVLTTGVTSLLLFILSLPLLLRPLFRTYSLRRRRRFRVTKGGSRSGEWSSSGIWKEQGGSPRAADLGQEEVVVALELWSPSLSPWSRSSTGETLSRRVGGEAHRRGPYTEEGTEVRRQLLLGAKDDEEEGTTTRQWLLLGVEGEEGMAMQRRPDLLGWHRLVRERELGKRGKNVREESGMREGRRGQACGGCGVTGYG